MADLKDQDDMTKGTCGIEGCEERHYALGWCNHHWQKSRRYGDPLGGRSIAKPVCSIPACGEPSASRGWCKSHYMSWYRHGDPLWTAPEPTLTCSICGAPHRVRGWCSAHYQKWLKYGDPLGSAPERVPRLCDFPNCGKPHCAHGYCETHWRHTKRGLPLLPIDPQASRRKYTLDHHYFDEITDERRAYWLGFITADGCVVQAEGRRVLVVDLAEYDADHLRMLCADLGSDRPLHFSRSCAQVSFNSKRIFEALGRHGVRPRKSKVVEPWDGPEELMPHYWRGLVDGDGTLSQAKKNPKWTNRKWTIALVGSEACVRTFADWAASICGATAVPRLVSTGGCWSWGVSGTTKPQLLASALYRDASISLARKQARADQLIDMDFTGLR